MGNNCANYPPPEPDTANVCSLYVDQTYQIPHFCTLSGLGGKQNRIVWCDKLSNKGEWTLNTYDDFSGTNASTCTYDDCGNYKETEAGCCNGCCGITGRGVACVRAKFTGDPVKCCVNDLACTDDPANLTNDACFTDPSHQETCDPCYRSMTSNANTVVPISSSSNTTCGATGKGGCQDVMLAYCSGADNPDGSVVDIDELTARWEKPIPGRNVSPCVLALERNIFANAPTPCLAVGVVVFDGLCKPITPSSGVTGDQNSITTSPNNTTAVSGINNSTFSAEGIRWASELFDALFIKYASLGFVVGSIPGNVGYNPFQDFLYQMCCKIPIVCQSSLNSVCAIYSAQRLSLNPDVANWCGCYLPESEYVVYVDTYEINQECTPMCNRNSTIPLVEGDNTPLYCSQDICVIDDIAINLNTTNVNGGINIAQMCGNCSGGLGTRSTCSCIIQNNTIDTAGAQIGSININEVCSSTICNVTNPGFVGMPPVIQVPCGSPSDPNSVYSQAVDALNIQKAEERRKKTITYLIIIGVALLFVILLYFIIRPNFKSEPAKIIPQSSNAKPVIGLGKEGKAIGSQTFNGAASRTDIGSQTFNGAASRTNNSIGITIDQVGSRYF